MGFCVVVAMNLCSTGPSFYTKTMIKNVLEPDIRIYCTPIIFLNS